MTEERRRRRLASSRIMESPGRLRAASPVEDLLGVLVAHECTVDTLCRYLRACRLYDALALLKDEEALEITRHPDADGAAASVALGRALRLCCEARGIPGPSYAWFYENQELPGQTSGELVVPHFGLEQEGTYHCAVSQRGRVPCTLHSREVEATVAPVPPRIVLQPERTVFKLCSTEAALECRAEGHPRPCYQWFRDNTVLDGCTSAVLKIPFVSDRDEGEYKCLVRNVAGDVYSEKCILKTYKPCPPIPGQKDLPDVPKVSVKVALLIGNRSYAHQPLRTPWQDVKTLAQILRTKGFMVIALKDLTLVEMRGALRLFCSLLRKAAYGVFYFAGHGFERSHKYMMPVDATEHRCGSCLSEKEVAHCAQQRQPHLVMLVPDMCLSRVKLTDRHAEPEDFEFSGDKNLLIACATTSGHKAFDGEANGEYVTYLKQCLPWDMPIHDVLRYVCSVMPGKQSPLNISNLAGSHVLSVPAEGDPEVEAEYRRVTGAGTPLCVHFPAAAVRSAVTCHPLDECFHNALELVFHDVDVARWDVRCELLSFKELDIEHVEGAPFHITVIHNLQKAKLYSKSELSLRVTVNLFERKSNTCVGNTILDLGYPLITSANLWLEAPTCVCRKCEKRRGAK
ncbi:mucosa-associated lymphoid tissue lymphoma translocation protein 1 homolog isoform X2 [Bacillus rossius redtenbacheri]|uniref:mucosa-associated lymphoid tissue lymphoma translocation protein 1 homolog isoform X2 n=1 Tax=Bacillus rossius redtenbacheri TaxID=93214 RepID=UPI002FDCE447